MTTLLLIRHAVNDWVKTGKLAGRMPGVHLNEEGRQQASALGTRLAARPLTAIYSSPLERTIETAEAVARHHPALSVQVDRGLEEVDFGRWQGEELATLAHRNLWHVVQRTPARAAFPDGETVRGAQMRMVDALEAIARRHPGETVAIVSHSDIIKLVLAYYLGMPLDLFQRIVIAPASISALQLSAGHAAVLLMNDTGHLPEQHAEDGKG